MNEICKLNSEHINEMMGFSSLKKKELKEIMNSLGGHVNTYGWRDGEVLAGFVVAMNCHNAINVLHVEVREDYRREYIGSDLIDHLISKLSSKRRKIMSIVPSDNFGTHKFLKHNGLKLVTEIGDLRIFEMSVITSGLPKKEKPPVSEAVHNRIAKYFRAK